MKTALKMKVLSILRSCGYEVRKTTPKADDGAFVLPDDRLYRPLYSPWWGEGEFRTLYLRAAERTLVSIEGCHVLYTLIRQTLNLPGDVWECGVYRGGTAALMADLMASRAPDKKLCLFDTFAGMPDTDRVRDWHKAGEFSDTSLETVSAFVGNPDICEIHRGFIPETFKEMEGRRICFAHIDVDIYQSVTDCLEFIWPRMSAGGMILFDDYGQPTCPGAREAVDQFFKDLPIVPLCLQTGQAVAFKGVP